MRSIFLTSAIWVIASVALGQPVAVIDGPTVALPGELVVLSSANSKGDNHKWIAAANLSTAQAGCDSIASQLFFATPKLGSYDFILIVSDKSAAIEFTRHTVVIKQLTPPVDPPPVDPPPTTPPSGDYAKLTELSKLNSQRLNDPTTRRELGVALKFAIAEIKALCASGQCPTLQGAQSKAVKAIEATLLTRPRTSRGIDWEQGWRTPNNTMIGTMKITTVDAYILALTALVAGLEAT